MPAQNYVLQERSDERVPEEGVTHTSDPGARLWPVEVHFSTGLRPSRETVRAVSAAQALEFVAARYRFADMARTRVLDDEPADAPPIVTTVNDMEARRLADLLYDELPGDGSTMSDDEARDALSTALDRYVPDGQFQQVKRRLVESGRAKRCRGRGGPLARVMEEDPPAPRPAPPVPAHPIPKLAPPPAKPATPIVPPAASTVSAPSSHRSASIPRVTRGETDALGRTTLSDENIRAAAILHATGRATWDELADTIGCNRDHLRRKAGRMKPSIPAADLQLPAPVDAAAGPLIALHPTVGWVVAMDSTAEAMTAAGFTAITTLQQLAGRR